jgi:hypothetical protein
VELVRTPIGLGLTVDSHYKVLAIAKGSQAKRSRGIAVGDQLVSINDVPLSGGGSFDEQLSAIAVGTKVRLVTSKPAGSAKTSRIGGLLRSGGGGGAMPGLREKLAAKVTLPAKRARADKNSIANRASDATADTDDSGPIARARQSVFEAFAMPGLREKVAAKVTLPAKRARADKNSIMVENSTAQPALVDSMLFALPETSKTPNSTSVSSADEPPPPKVVTSVALASLSKSEPLSEESVAPQLPQPAEAKDEYKSTPSRDELGRSSSPTNTVNSSACSEAPRRRRRKKPSVPASLSGDQATETALAESSIAEASQSSDANVVPVAPAKVRRRRTKKVVKERDPYSDDPYAVELDPTELDL